MSFEKDLIFTVMSTFYARLRYYLLNHSASEISYLYSFDIKVHWQPINHCFLIVHDLFYTLISRVEILG